jgi:predicted N-acetyltransferase YhbS
MDREALSSLSIRPLREQELAAADRIFRRSFGTFLGLPDPESFGGDAGLLRSRWRAGTACIFAAELNGELVGTTAVSYWGSLGFLGPLTVSPELWDRGIGRALMGAATQQFAAWGTGHMGLFTFSNSPKHLHLYGKYGFNARFLTPVMSKTVAADAGPKLDWSRFAVLTGGERGAALQACRAVADAVYTGLDLTREIEAVAAQQMGDTVLLLEQDRVSGFAVCYCGPGTEAPSGECYVKFGTVEPEAGADLRFARLLTACEAFAHSRGLERVSAGINLGCDAAYRRMCLSGFRTDFIGVAMQQPNEAGYNRSDRYVISDWR